MSDPLKGFVDDLFGPTQGVVQTDTLPVTGQVNTNEPPKQTQEGKEKNNPIEEVLKYLGGFAKYQVFGGYDEDRRRQADNAAKELAVQYLMETGNPTAAYNALKTQHPDVFEKANMAHVVEELMGAQTKVLSNTNLSNENEIQKNALAKNAFLVGGVLNGRDIKPKTGFLWNDYFDLMRLPSDQYVTWTDPLSGKSEMIRGLGFKDITTDHLGNFLVDLTDSEEVDKAEKLMSIASTHNVPSEWIAEQIGFDPLTLYKAKEEIKTDEKLKGKPAGKSGAGGGLGKKVEFYYNQIGKNFVGAPKEDIMSVAKAEAERELLDVNSGRYKELSKIVSDFDGKYKALKTDKGGEGYTSEEDASSKIVKKFLGKMLKADHERAAIQHLKQRDRPSLRILGLSDETIDLMIKELNDFSPPWWAPKTALPKVKKTVETIDVKSPDVVRVKNEKGRVVYIRKEDFNPSKHTKLE